MPLLLFVMGILLLAWRIWPDILVDVFTRLCSQIFTIAHSWLPDGKDQIIVLAENFQAFPGLWALLCQQTLYPQRKQW